MHTHPSITPSSTVPSEQPKPRRASVTGGLAAACAAVAASSATLLLALSPALFAPSGELSAQGLQTVELPRVVISAHRESMIDGTRVDAGHVHELPRVLITAQREPGGARLAAGESTAGQPVMQRRDF